MIGPAPAGEKSKNRGRWHFLLKPDPWELTRVGRYSRAIERAQEGRSG